MRIMTTLSDDALDNLQIFITGLSTHKPYTYVFVDNLHHEIKLKICGIYSVAPSGSRCIMIVEETLLETPLLDLLSEVMSLLL